VPYVTSQKAKKQGEMPLPILSPIPSSMNGMRLRIGNGISLIFEKWTSLERMKCNNLKVLDVCPDARF